MKPGQSAIVRSWKVRDPVIELKVNKNPATVTFAQLRTLESKLVNAAKTISNQNSKIKIKKKNLIVTVWLGESD